jgi:hypothetical protein
MKNPDDRASMDVDGTGKHHSSSWSAAFFSKKAVDSAQWWLLPPSQGCATRRTICVAAALLATAAVVLTAGTGPRPTGCRRPSSFSTTRKVRSTTLHKQYAYQEIANDEREI